MPVEDLGEFKDNYLRAVAMFEDFSKALMWIGLGGDKNLEQIRNSIIRHGAETYKDINKP